MLTLRATRSLIAFILLFNGIFVAHGSPILPWEKFTKLSAKLNQLALHLTHDVPRNLQQVQLKTTGGAVLIAACDMCNPTSLTIDSTPCLRKIDAALQNYTRMFGEGGLFRGSQWESSARSVAETATSLHRLLQPVLLQDRYVNEEQKVPQNGAAEERLLDSRNEWMRAELQRYSVERLLSFSILAARVFAAGDPAAHGQGAEEGCAALQRKC